MKKLALALSMVLLLGFSLPHAAVSQDAPARPWPILWEKYDEQRNWNKLVAGVAAYEQYLTDWAKEREVANGREEIALLTSDILARTFDQMGFVMASVRWYPCFVDYAEAYYEFLLTYAALWGYVYHTLTAISVEPVTPAGQRVVTQSWSFYVQTAGFYRSQVTC